MQTANAPTKHSFAQLLHGESFVFPGLNSNATGGGPHVVAAKRVCVCVCVCVYIGDRYCQYYVRGCVLLYTVRYDSDHIAWVRPTNLQNIPLYILSCTLT